MTKEFFQKNRSRLLESVNDKSLVIMFSGRPPHKSADQYYPFSVNRNFYYMTGINEKNIILLMSKNGSSTKETIYIEESKPENELWEGKKISIIEASDKSGVDNVVYVDSFRDTLIRTLLTTSLDNVYLDLERRDWEEGYISSSFAREVKDKFSQLVIRNLYYAVAEMRTVKSAEEIESIRRAIKVTSEGLMNILTNLRPGLTEYQMEAYYDFTVRSEGVEEAAFSTIAARGVNATVLHYCANKDTLEDGDLILFDLGATHELYCADISRTYPVNGKFSPRQKELYNCVLKTQKAAVNAARPGVTLGALNGVARDVLSQELIRVGLIKEPEEVGKYFPHGVGHFLGLDVHDTGGRDTVLKENMVITIEPGVYIPEENIGIRIEDDVLITKHWNEVLSKDIPKEADKIEKIMQGKRKK